MPSRIVVYVALWHNCDIQHPLELGPFTAVLPTLGPEGRLTRAFRTQFRGMLKDGS